MKNLKKNKVKKESLLKDIESLNAAYDAMPDSSEKALQTRMKAKHRELVKYKW